MQWFSGTILTGLCGAALIGGAVFASLDGEMTFAKVPERVEGAWFRDGETRMDDQQHALAALLRTQAIVRALRARGANVFASGRNQ